MQKPYLNDVLVLIKNLTLLSNDKQRLEKSIKMIKEGKAYDFNGDVLFEDPLFDGVNFDVFPQKLPAKVTKDVLLTYNNGFESLIRVLLGEQDITVKIRLLVEDKDIPSLNELVPTLNLDIADAMLITEVCYTREFDKLEPLLARIKDTTDETVETASQDNTVRDTNKPAKQKNSKAKSDVVETASDVVETNYSEEINTILSDLKSAIEDKDHQDFMELIEELSKLDKDLTEEWRAIGYGIWGDTSNMLTDIDKDQASIEDELNNLVGYIDNNIEGNFEDAAFECLRAIEEFVGTGHKVYKEQAKRIKKHFKVEG